MKRQPWQVRHSGVLALAVAVVAFPVLLLFAGFLVQIAVSVLVDAGMLSWDEPEALLASVWIGAAVVLAYLPSRWIYRGLSERWADDGRRYCPYCGANITGRTQELCPKCGNDPKTVQTD